MSNSRFILESSGIQKDYIDEKYGKHGTQYLNGMPSLSIPLEWKNEPEGTRAYAVIMQDYDAIPVVGFSWIHWVVVISGDYKELEENASLEDIKLTQGANSWLSPLGNLDRNTASHFGGPAPPDADHTYEIKIYALSEMPNLENGFFLNELYKRIRGKILDEAILEGIYRK